MVLKFVLRAYGSRLFGQMIEDLPGSCPTIYTGVTDLSVQAVFVVSVCRYSALGFLGQFDPADGRWGPAAGSGPDLQVFAVALCPVAVVCFWIAE